MPTVYLIRSKTDPTRRYIGITADLSARLRKHNSGRTNHTAKYRPWELVTAIWFAEGSRARAFERYLKSGSGNAFAIKRLW